MLDCRAIDWLALLITDCNRPALLTDGVSCLALSEPLAGFAESPETRGPLEHVIGLQRFTAPAAVGPVSMSIVRKGKVVARCRSPWKIEAEPDRQDPLYAGFSSLRGCN